jgi:hypothetical protein
MIATTEDASLIRLTVHLPLGSLRAQGLALMTPRIFLVIRVAAGPLANEKLVGEALEPFGSDRVIATNSDNR